MNGMERMITIAVAAVATLITRFLPFILFRGRKTPKFLDYIGYALPGSVFGLLLVYALKDTTVLSYPYALPEVLSLGLTSFFYLWKKNTLSAIAIGTVFYMVLVQTVFYYLPSPI